MPIVPLIENILYAHMRDGNSVSAYNYELVQVTPVEFKDAIIKEPIVTSLCTKNLARADVVEMVASVDVGTVCASCLEVMYHMSLTEPHISTQPIPGDPNPIFGPLLRVSDG